MSFDTESIPTRRLALARARPQIRNGRRVAVHWLFDLDGWALLALVAWTGLAVVLQLRQAAQLGGSFTGIQSLYPPDQFQYLAWIRDAGTHGLIGDHFQLVGSPHYDFLQPMFLISGLVWRLGVNLPLAYLIWAPVAVGLTWWSFRTLIRRHLTGWAAVAAMALALAYMSPIAALAFRDSGTVGGLQAVGGELSNMTAFWGYFPRTIAVALLPVLLLCLEAVIEPQRRAPGRSATFYVIGATGAALFAAWLHPWQGAVALFIIVGVAIWSGPTWSRLRMLAPPAAGALLPLLYYEALVHYDLYWRIGNSQSDAIPHQPLSLLATLLPLGAIAVIAARWRFTQGTHRRLLFLWVGGAGLGLLVTTSFPLHMLDGLTLPLGILAVEGWQRLWRRLSGVSRRLAGRNLRLSTMLAVAGVAVCTLPGLYYFASMFRASQHNGEFGTSFTASDDAALNYLEKTPEPGGVLAPDYIAAAVPPYTGRDTWTGQSAWTPDYGIKQATDWALFNDRLSPADTRKAVEGIGARFVLVDCQTPKLLAAVLKADILGQHVFGCAAVYELKAFAANPSAVAAVERSLTGE